MSDENFVAVLEHRFDTPDEATELFRKILLDKLNANSISQTLYDGLYLTFDASLGYDQVIQNINNIDIGSLSDEEQNMVTITKSILTNSYDYWTNWTVTHPDPVRPLRRPSNNQMSYIVDGIIGFGFAPSARYRSYWQPVHP